MRKVMIIALILVGALLIHTASAEVLTDEGSNYATFDLSSASTINNDPIKAFNIYNIQDWNGLYFVYVKIDKSYIVNHAVLLEDYSYSSDVTLKIGGDEVGTGTANYNTLYNSDGDIIGAQLWLDIDDWHPTGYIGTQKVQIVPSSGTLFNGLNLYSISDQVSETRPIGFIRDAGNLGLIKGIHISRAHYYWENVIDVSDEFVSLTRHLDGNHYVSTLQITSDAGYLTDTSPNNVDLPYVGTGTWNVTNPYGRIFEGILISDSATIPNVVTVYVQNANTGALIADTDLSVKNYDTSVWYNSTLEWGWDIIQLPDGNYEFYAEKSGFTQYAPGRLTVDGVDDNINLLLYPDVVAPPVGNITLQFWVCDSNSNGIPYAELRVLGLAGEGADYDSGIIQTNNLGYATLTAPGNSTYTAYASKPGYTAGENEFGVTTASPVHIAVMLMAGAVPTQTAVTPTITVEPTQTTPPIQEDNIIGLSVRGLAKGFGIDYDTALLLFGLMIVFGAGGIVMSSAKGGAMEFIAGSIVGTFVAFALGLIPIWIFIIIAVVFGAYVLRVFLQGGQ